MLVLGIDPGLSGALALYDSDRGSLEVEDVPVLELKKAGKTRRTVDLYALARIVDNMAPAGPTVWIENVSAMPRDGSVQAFAFGQTYGAILGVCAASFLTIEKVTPVSWKRALKLAGGKENKDESRARASTLLPRHAHLWPLKKHEGRAEAALIALYGAGVR